VNFISEISWNYVAGFFDGEGCVRIYTGKDGYPRLHCSIAQAEPRHEVLYALKDFLAEYEIGSQVYTKPGKNGASVCHYLWISKRVHLLAFLYEIRPFVIVKKGDVEEALAWLENNPPGYNPKRLHSKDEAQAMYEMWKDGMSQEEIAERFGTHQVAVSRAIRLRRKDLEIAV